MKIRTKYNIIRSNEKVKNKIIGNQPYYDNDSKQIHNAEKNTYAYFHEERHRLQDLYTPLHTFMNITHIYGYYSAIIGGLFFLIFKKYMLACLFVAISMYPFLVIITLLELDAYIFGLIYYLRFKYDNKNN